ncbi:MAG: hypothetical protein ACYTAN_09750 [Planctomycetota bacterium]|jgi:hypothetical protein
MGKRKKKSAVEAPAFDEDEWQAKQQVEEAFMGTSLAKREVRRVTKEIKSARKRIQQDVQRTVSQKPRRKRNR